jgi:hypothetical protein
MNDSSTRTTKLSAVMQQQVRPHAQVVTSDCDALLVRFTFYVTVSSRRQLPHPLPLLLRRFRCCRHCHRQQQHQLQLLLSPLSLLPKMKMMTRQTVLQAPHLTA